MPQDADYIWQLDPTAPTGTDPKSQGDDYFRQVHRALIGDGIDPLTGSFTTDFTGQYTGTADELNKINNPANIGMTVGNLTNTVINSPAEGDVLVYKTGNTWENERPSWANGTARISQWGTPELVGDAIQFAVQDLDELNTALGDFTLNSDGFGSKYVAAVDHNVCISLQSNLVKTAAGLLIFRGAIGVNAGSTFPSGINTLAYHASTVSTATDEDVPVGCSTSFSGALKAGDVVRFYLQQQAQTPAPFSYSTNRLSIQQQA